MSAKQRLARGQRIACPRIVLRSAECGMRATITVYSVKRRAETSKYTPERVSPPPRSGSLGGTLSHPQRAHAFLVISSAQRRLNMFFFFSGASAAAEPPTATSMLPLSEQMLHKHFGETVPPANSGYGADRRRRRMAELTAENTNRIRIQVDYSSLYEATAPLYSACFQVGEWYARGLAGPTPPADGVATCEGLTSGAQRACCARPASRTSAMPTTDTSP